MFQGGKPMKVIKLFSILIALAGAGVLAVAAAPSAFGQDYRPRDLAVLAGRGVEIGVSVRDVELTEADPQKAGGVLVEDVRPGSPAEKAGVKRSDVIIEFDGEHVRSARQFARLVQETGPGRS